MGHQSQLAACQHLGLCHGDRSFDLHLFQRQIAGSFVAQQGCDLANEVTELLGAGLFVAQQANLVLQQRMFNDHRGHKNTLLNLYRTFYRVLICALARPVGAQKDFFTEKLAVQASL